MPKIQLSSSMKYIQPIMTDSQSWVIDNDGKLISWDFEVTLTLFGTPSFARSLCTATQFAFEDIIRGLVQMQTSKREDFGTAQKVPWFLHNFLSTLMVWSTKWQWPNIKQTTCLNTESSGGIVYVCPLSHRSWFSWATCRVTIGNAYYMISLILCTFCFDFVTLQLSNFTHSLHLLPSWYISPHPDFFF